MSKRKVLVPVISGARAQWHEDGAPGPVTSKLLEIGGVTYISHVPPGIKIEYVEQEIDE